MLIDPRMLLEMGLITGDELAERIHGMSEGYVEYELIRIKQWRLLKKAFQRLEDKAYKDFDPFWFHEYAIYISLKHHFENEPWYDWTDKGFRSHDDKALKDARDKFGTEIEFHRFVQWLFDIQWRKLRDYANERGISLIGDMPIYVSEDSAEVWSRRELFDADPEGNFGAIGGVPPDYFTPDGQLWGNPIYNWKLLKKENYEWWIKRLKASLERYDVVRLDHFRGFESYWRVPAGSETARGGKWAKGPGMSLFKALEESLGDLSLSVIAEDLGIIDEKVETLLKESGFRGMRVLQFGFLGDDLHLPHNFPEESAAYTGTHDNTTLLAWIFGLAQEDRDKALFYSGFDGDWTAGGPNCAVIKSWLRTLFMTSASLAIIPVQDMLGYGADTRTNIPGTPSGNWRFRVRDGVFSEVDAGYFKYLHKQFQREDPVKEFAPVTEIDPPVPVEYYEEDDD